MKKFFPVYVRVPVIFAIFFIGINLIIEPVDGRPAFMAYPSVLVLIILFAFGQIAVEVVNSATNKVLDRLMTPQELAERERKQNIPFSELPWVKKLMQKLTGDPTKSQEQGLLLDHDYDGIKELDNNLPPWWVGLFYATIIFSVIYILRFTVFGGDNQIVEFDKEMAQAKAQVEAYNATAGDRLTAEMAVYLNDESNLAQGKILFDQNCVACHKVDGGGSIGPNLTDDHWILGGGVKNIFHTISEGGRPNMGMIPWKTMLKPKQIEQLTSYVISLNGTNPVGAKEPEGDIVWSKADLEIEQQAGDLPEQVDHQDIEQAIELASETDENQVD
ncbi:cbb3-type cytochrome c oxidase N-terminal domain-containing protein [Myroides sp. LJL119]